MRIHPRVLIIDKDYQNASIFRIENTSSKDDILYFKIRRTEPKIASFEPREGVVLPGSHVNITVMLTEFQQRGCRIVVKFVAVRRHKTSGNFEQDWERGMRRGVMKKLVEVQNAIYASSSDEFSIDGEDDSTVGPRSLRKSSRRRPPQDREASDSSDGSSDIGMDRSQGTRGKLSNRDHSGLNNHALDAVNVRDVAYDHSVQSPSSFRYSVNSSFVSPTRISAAEDLQRSLRDLSNSLQLSGPLQTSELALQAGAAVEGASSPPRRMDVCMSVETAERPMNSPAALDSRERQIDMRDVKVVNDTESHIVAASESRLRVQQMQQTEHALRVPETPQTNEMERTYRKELFGESVHSPSPFSHNPSYFFTSSQAPGSNARADQAATRPPATWGSPVRVSKSPERKATSASSSGANQSPGSKNLKPVLRCSDWKLFEPQDIEKASIITQLDSQEPVDEGLSSHRLYTEIFDAFQQLEVGYMFPALSRADGTSPSLLQLHMHGDELTDELARETLKIRLADMYYAKDCVFVVKISNAPLFTSLHLLNRVFETPVLESSDAKKGEGDSIPVHSMFDDLFEKTLLRLEVKNCPYLYTIPSKTMSRFTMLVHLDLSHNKIREIKGRLGLELPNLQRLDLSHNMLPTLDKLQGLICLTWLDASYNCIETLHNGPYMLVNHAGHLKSINLIGNKICKLISYASEVVGVLPRLEFFDLRCISLYLDPRLQEFGQSLERGRSSSRGSSPARTRSSSVGSAVSVSRNENVNSLGSASQDDSSVRMQFEGNLYSTRMRSIARTMFLEEQKRRLIRERIKHDVKQIVDRTPIQNLRFAIRKTAFEAPPPDVINLVPYQDEQPSSPSGRISEFLRSKDGQQRDELAARSRARAGTPSKAAGALLTRGSLSFDTESGAARYEHQSISLASRSERSNAKQATITIPDPVEASNFSRPTYASSVRVIESYQKNTGGSVQASPLRRSTSRDSAQLSSASSRSRSFSPTRGRMVSSSRGGNRGSAASNTPRSTGTMSASSGRGKNVIYNQDRKLPQTNGLIVPQPVPYNNQRSPCKVNIAEPQLPTAFVASKMSMPSFDQSLSPMHTAFYPLEDVVRKCEESLAQHISPKKPASSDAESASTSSISASSPSFKAQSNVDSTFESNSTKLGADSFVSENARVSSENNDKNPSNNSATIGSLMQPPVGVVGDDKPLKPRADLARRKQSQPLIKSNTELPPAQSNRAVSVKPVAVELALMSQADIEELKASPDPKTSKDTTSPKNSGEAGFSSFYSSVLDSPANSKNSTADALSFESTASSAKAFSVEENLVAGDDTDDEYVQWLNAQVANASISNTPVPVERSSMKQPSPLVTNSPLASATTQEPSTAMKTSLLSPLPKVKHPREIARRPEQVPASPADELSPLSKIMGQITDSSAKYNPWLHRQTDSVVTELFS